MSLKTELWYFQMIRKQEGDNGANVKVSGWVSTDSLDGEEWEIYIQADGKLYNTKYKLAL